MEGPYFDNTEHQFYIDIYVNNLAGEEVTLIDIEISYSNLEWIIDETLTTASAYGGLDYLNADDIQYGAGKIEITGVQTPFNDGPVFTTSNSQLLLSIYFTATARSCSDFIFEDLLMVITDGSTPSGWLGCEGEVGTNCTVDDYCIAAFDLGGVIESPVMDCDGAYNGGIPLVDILITESNNLDIFDCETETDAYGEYECGVVADLDFTITPENDYLHSCGLSSLDLDLYQDHLLVIECLEEVWQWIAGDCTGNGILAAGDLVEIQKAILDDPISFPSWTFVPSSTYNGMSLPSCPTYNGDQNIVPSYDPFIDVEDVDENMPNLNFVGIKMGDANATCTECSDSFWDEEDIFSRSSPITVNIDCQNENEVLLSFDIDMEGLEVVFLAFECASEPSIIYNSFQNKETFITRYHNGVFYVSYVSMNIDGETFKKGDAILKLNGNFPNFKKAGKSVHNELISKEFHARINFNVTKNYKYSVYPNPVHNELKITTAMENKRETFYLYNLLGELVIISPLQDNVNTVPLNLVQGLYLYEIRDGFSSSSTGKLIVE